MATLTIKPTAAGNDVQIKSGDGNTTHATFGDTSTATLDTATITNATIADATITAGTFPANHVIYKDYLSFTSTAANSDPDDTWTDTSLSLTVPSATADTLSSIWIGVSNSINLEPSTHSYAQFRLVRVDPGADVVLAIITTGHDGAWWTKMNGNLQGQDESLVTGEDHVYKYQFRSQSAGQSLRIWYHGYSSTHCIATMSLLGFK